MALILASRSTHRAQMLARAGVTFEVRAASVDERAVENALGPDVTPADRAEVLARVKAEAVSEHEPGATVIGCDQILELDGSILHKADTMADARRRLLALQGRTHTLHSAICLVRDGETIWSTVVPAHMTMRSLTPKAIGHYLADAGDAILGSVGCYQIEAHGIRLFETIDGDWWTIVGLPLLPLLAALRANALLTD